MELLKVIVVVLQCLSTLETFVKILQAKLHANLEKLISDCPRPPLEEMLRTASGWLNKIQHHFENWGDTVDW